ncbi:MAG TPA: HAD family hydrolase [Candidatus Ozemobacteraceae bacterium]|mgnify:CR=1 FL=1|nr:HAD family hydrolase [Candidatus Ozemobacteraceae bacterium]
MKSQIKGIFFDMGGTLVFPDPVRISAAFRSHLGVSVTKEQCLEAIHAATVSLDRQLEVPSQKPGDWWIQYFTAILAHCSSGKMPAEDSTAAAFESLRAEHKVHNLWSYFDPETEELLNWLDDEGFFLGIISNSDGRVKAQLREAALIDRFEFVLDSHEVGVEKPDAGIFKMALDASRLSPEEVLYIGDFVYIDGIGASRAGLLALIIDPLGQRAGWGFPTVKSLGEVRTWLESA